ncbi:serine/threonine-protein kinase [Paenibacillus sp. 2TAB23]|uniref:serine/threonine-protein kinase n=1 Tax=Paenibacillus sp. 2TAB23 TaxID=3233004 RepID=UPI003F9E23E4
MGNNAAWFDPYATGSVLDGRYRIAGILGSGGMGIVYAADDLRLGNKLTAIKVLAPRLGAALLAEEAKLLMMVDHPHLPTILNYYPATGDLHETCVMTYIDGHTVADYYRANGSGFTFKQIMHVVKQLCSALHYLHTHAPPIIHRDLKPSNVMIDAKWQVKLIDFGISRRYRPDREQDTEQLGTKGFAAPEQAGSGQSDKRTDIYGLGALLYFMASGGLIYHSVSHHANRDDLFSLLKRDTPAAFKTVLRGLLQSDPRLRYQSIKDVETALAPFMYRSYSSDEYIAAVGNEIRGSKSPLSVCVLSLSSGAGATFLTHALANLLGKKGISVSAAEYEHARPEWHAWLNGIRKWDDPDERKAVALDPRYMLYKQKIPAMNWFALQAVQEKEITLADNRFTQMLRQTEAPVHLIDLSQRWTDSHAQQLMRSARFVIAVGDPAVAKWRACDLKQLHDLSLEIEAAGSQLLFVANKDVSFDARRAWLVLFPAKPNAIVPRLPDEILLSQQWRGHWATDNKRLASKLNQALAPILKLLCNELNTE